MESVDSDVNSVDEEVSLLNDSDCPNSDRRKSASTTTGFDETEDTRSELKFDEGKDTARSFCSSKARCAVSALESEAEKEKRIKIEEALKNKRATLKTWQQLALEEYGLVNGTKFDCFKRK